MSDTSHGATKSSQYAEFGFSDAVPRQVSSYITRPVLDLSGPIDAGIRVLDVGCGNGWMSAVFAEHGCSVVGIDPSEQGVALARKAHPSIRFEVCEANEHLLEALGEQPFDLVVSTEVVEHLYAPMPYAIGISKALRPGGRFVCTTPYHGYLKNLSLALADKHDFHTHPLRQGGHIKFWSRATLTTLLEGAGFVNIEFRGAGRIPLLWKSMVMCGDRPKASAQGALGPMSVKARSLVPVSAVVMTKNEERNIEQCLASLSSFDEVFVVDSESTDRTRELAKQCGAQVVSFSWNGEYPKKKQWSLDNLPFSHQWVFYADADEVVTPKLAKELGRLFHDGPFHKGYFVSYDYVFLGRVLRHGWRPRKLVLLDRDVSRFLDVDDLEVDNFWEVEGHYQPEVLGSVGCLENRMVHNDHDTLYQYFDRHNRYSDWEAHINVGGTASDSREARHGLRSVLKRVLARVPFRGLLFFIYCYWVRGGFLDGRAGLHYALSKSFYYWQIALKEGGAPQGPVCSA